MDPLHARLARLGLESAADYGFVLAGGYAVQAHGFLERLSDDVDLFTDVGDPVAFAEAVAAVADTYRQAGMTVEIERRGDVFARLSVVDEQGREAKVELGCDWRARPPAFLEIGPVLHPDDATATSTPACAASSAPPSEPAASAPSPRPSRRSPSASWTSSTPTPGAGRWTCGPGSRGSCR
ncbi:nucleotidyl transferase AbiEii/AbiGii toxin family protein [Actinacidiphila oryziradicis]|uniref:Nucleotidyl transferase AbiEii/AbiGii toxin family protein n=1 Tax=Actinacidiphila oryziradicis TaxID=2571141 RepID=A0A4U0RU16_9ACTN|nr:hypothetical protein FCI23_44940 [Actinacidiphila oryziradicis]